MSVHREAMRIAMPERIAAIRRRLIVRHRHRVTPSLATVALRIPHRATAAILQTRRHPIAAHPRRGPIAGEVREATADIVAEAVVVTRAGVATQVAEAEATEAAVPLAVAQGEAVRPAADVPEVPRAAAKTRRQSRSRVARASTPEGRASFLALNLQRGGSLGSPAGSPGLTLP